jgi:hypothetical protein
MYSPRAQVEKRRELLAGRASPSLHQTNDKVGSWKEAQALCRSVNSGEQSNVDSVAESLGSATICRTLVRNGPMKLLRLRCRSQDLPVFIVLRLSEW